MHLYYAGKGLQWLAQRMGFEAGSTGMSTVFTLGLILGCMIIPYLLGNFNTAIILGKALRHEDIRQFGSGNAGTTMCSAPTARAWLLRPFWETFSRRRLP